MANQDHGHYLVEPGAVSQETQQALKAAILASPLLGRNPLNRYFQTTLGFSVVFRREALTDVMDRFPAFTPYLQRALSPMANAFYLNPLVIPGGGRVERHADLSLRSYVTSVANPAFVSVLYVQVPAGMSGGELRLYRPDDSIIATIRPQENTLLTFQGDLRHDVTEVSGNGESPRISLVCEQYCLNPDQLADVPRLTAQSHGGFAAFLAMEED
jgi:hypothetical protein